MALWLPGSVWQPEEDLLEAGLKPGTHMAGRGLGGERGSGLGPTWPE